MTRSALRKSRRVVLETGMVSTFLYHGLIERTVTVESIWTLPGS